MAHTRKYFGTDGIRARVGSEHMNAAFALRLGYAAGVALAHNTSSQPSATGRPCVLIGKDTRVSGYMIESALEAGLASAGVDSLLCGPIPTPAVAYLTRALRLAAGIVISASHNPYYDNGIKFFSGDGFKLPDAVEAQIEAAIDAPMQCASDEKPGRARRLSDAAGRYIEFCKSTFPNNLNLNGLKLVVDGANGAAYHIAPHVFRELGAQVIAIGCEPNGLNINDGVGALHPESLAKAVLAHGADLGIALDGDADRLQIVDRTGRIFNGDELLYAIAKDRIQSGPVAGIVGTLMTNAALENRLRELNVPFVRAKVGDRYVMEQLVAKGWQLGGESSGHLIMLDKHSTGDGIVAALQVLALVVRSGNPLAQSIADLTLYTQHMINVTVPTGFDWQQHQPLVQAAKQVEQQLGNKGRVLIRPSGTEPKLRLMVEAQEAQLARDCAQSLAATVPA